MALVGTVLFVHGVGGPTLGWDKALAAAMTRAGDDASAVTFRTLRYDDVFAEVTDDMGCTGDVGDRGEEPRQWWRHHDGEVQVEIGMREPSRLTRSQLTALVAGSLDSPEGTDGSKRVRLPVPVPGDVIARLPFAGMPHARAYRWDDHQRLAARRRIVDGIAEVGGLTTAPSDRIGGGAVDLPASKGIDAAVLPGGGCADLEGVGGSSDAGSRREPTVVIAHSLGSVVTVDALLSHGVTVDLLVTIGSPIGVDRVWCAEWTWDGAAMVGDNDYKLPPAGLWDLCIPAWLNVVNTRDVIPWGRGVQGRFPHAVDAYITAGRMMVGPGGAHDPQVYTRSTVVSTAVALALLD